MIPWAVAHQAPLPGILQARRLEQVAIPSVDLPSPEIKPDSVASLTPTGGFLLRHLGNHIRLLWGDLKQTSETGK